MNGFQLVVTIELLVIAAEIAVGIAVLVSILRAVNAAPKAPAEPAALRVSFGKPIKKET